MELGLGLGLFIINEEDLIVNTELNIRLNCKTELEGLKTSIENDGLFQPLIVELNKENKFVLVDGFRRFFAMKELGHKSFICRKIV